VTIAVSRGDSTPPASTPATGAWDAGHERVVIRQDAESGLRMIVAVHSTVLGPALGGLRLRAYPGGLRDALDDVLALAATMTLKASAAGLDLGGGKAVMIDDGDDSRREQRFAAVADVIDELGGSYITAEDVGTTTADMDLIAARTPWVTGRSVEAGGAGDPSPTTATTVFAAIGRALEHAFGSPDPAGRRIAVVGLGKVGWSLAERLARAGASVIGTDIDPERVERLVSELGAEPAPSAEALIGAKLDVLAPCAMGGMIDEAIAGALDTRVVCGAANNPLTSPPVARRLAERGILYVPDFLANCGGLIHVDAERRGFDPRLVEEGVERAMERLDEALAAAVDGDRTPLEAAERQARSRIARARAAASAPA
jgi:glutamate dehydrogenase/leucine dehydrogenase